MNSDFNPGPVSENPQGDSGDALARAFEDLVQGLAPPSGAPPSGSWAAGSESGAPHGGSAACPEPGAWALLLSADVSSPQSARVSALLAHAAACRLCAQRLRTLSAEVSTEESAVLAGLACASAQGRRTLASELARTPHQVLCRPATRLYLWTGAGLAASLLIAAGLLSWWRLENNPERLLAEAYAQARIFDLRMPGAAFAEVTPWTHLRGGSAAREPARLLEARARIEHQLENAPEDAHWLQLGARADILEEKFDPAIDILDRLVAAGPVTAGLLLDDASAYYQRGEATGSENDRNTALDSLRRAD